VLNPYFKVKDPTQRYKQLLFYAQKLKGFPEVFKSYLRKSFLEGLFFLKEQKIDQNKVPGCTSQVSCVSIISNICVKLNYQVWILSDFKEGKFYFLADSDSQLTKGLAGLLVEGLRGSSKEEILNVPPEFIEKLGLKQTLTPSRTNGFLNMLKLVKQRVSEQSSENSKNT
jgi:sulfur transfer protein SufE